MKKRILLTVATALLPYFVLFALAVIFFLNDYPVFGFFMESVFHSNVLNLFAVILIYCFFNIVLCFVCFIAEVYKKTDALQLAKSAIVMKLILLPSYLVIFVLGFFLMITIFTFPFSIGLFLLDCLTLFLTGLFNLAAIINSVRQGFFKTKEVIWIAILQFIFCADVIASLVFYYKLRKRCKTENGIL